MKNTRTRTCRCCLIPTTHRYLSVAFLVLALTLLNGEFHNNNNNASSFALAEEIAEATSSGEGIVEGNVDVDADVDVDVDVDTSGNGNGNENENGNTVEDATESKSEPTATDTATDADTATATAIDPKSENYWGWDRIVKGDKPIISNGNIYPPSPTEKWTDCLILVTRNQIMWHCPEGDDDNYDRTIIYRDEARFRGAFSAPGTDGRRLWILDGEGDYDVLIELDTVDGEVLQVLEIEGTSDGHDAVRVGNRIFMVDTRGGDIVEIELPASEEPYYESSLKEGATDVWKDDWANVVKRHKGFSRLDHINNVAVHPDVLVASLHGGSGIKIGKRRDNKDNATNAPTRHSVLLRSTPEEEGRELNVEMDGFAPVTNMGTWCHNTAFWKDEATSQVKLVALNSKAGSIVSVVVSGPNVGERNEIWLPDMNHPVLIPPKGVARAYKNGAHVFSKGLAVQDNVAFFGVSYARAPNLRQTVPESLLVAVDLITGKEKWVRVIRSNGLIGQILTESYLGWQMQLPADMSTIEMTYHGVGGIMVKICDDADDYVDEGETPFCDDFASVDRKINMKCKGTSQLAKKGKELCCACGGGDEYQSPMLAGGLDAEILKVEDHITATTTFAQSSECLDANGVTKQLPLKMKQKREVRNITNFDMDLQLIIKHLCNLDVDPIAQRLIGMGDDGTNLDKQFTNDFQTNNGNAIIKARSFENKIKLGATGMQLIFSSRSANEIYHFPWLNDWLPMLEERIFKPIGVPVNRIIRMMFANMPEGSTINFHQDKNTWVQRAHRVHVPIITHQDIFFLSQIIAYDPETEESEKQILRVKSNAGEVYEFNNALAHAVRNLGSSRIHLIIDWTEEPIEESAIVKLSPGDLCAHDQTDGLVCAPEAVEQREEL